MLLDVWVEGPQFAVDLFCGRQLVLKLKTQYKASRKVRAEVTGVGCRLSRYVSRNN